MALGSLLIWRMLFRGAPSEEESAVTSDPCAALIPHLTQSSSSPGQAGLAFSFAALLVGVQLVFIRDLAPGLLQPS